MKNCYKCNKTKDISEFSINKNKPDGLNLECKECANKYMKEYYRKNKHKHLKAVEKQVCYRRAKVAKYKMNKGCNRCGYKEHPSALSFHHIEKEDKKFTIGCNIHLPWDILLEEIEKCEVLCMNCHAIEHSKYDWTIEEGRKKTKKRKPLDLNKRTINKRPPKQRKRKSNIPANEILEKMLWEFPSEELAKKFNCSGSYLSRYCKERNIKKPSRGYWT